ncbi:uncharacterized protein K444DRAFT_66462 [Hyaloscypha bicolor E]|uniref:Uncharacterized protein n=1 Tax=Hyaloscypha bicolor E TaxID=1095630 RepID=A0A2J6T0H8_9HELO|nr:uncharacterized protein K444DRAFT_66462 [Hyaloscypha bicolor E]PMD56517.1 hypothetical protein K444DRAFT_66462 [Hyaloscypha bicolor E]
MRGQIFFSYALVAFATTAYSSPLVARTDEVEARSPYVVDGKAFNGGIVDVGKEFVERRKYIVARAGTGTVSKASATSKPGVAKSTGAAAPKATSKSGAAKATGATPPKATSKPGAAKATGATASKASVSKAGATTKPAAAKATTPADLPGCPAVGGAKASASKSGAAKATGAARRADKPLGCDPTKLQAK